MADITPQPIGWNETDRLAALRRYGILDTAPEAEFDEITRVAALVCDVPMALVSLIEDDRQWFKSERGLGINQTGRGVSFCAHAIFEADVLVVPDAHQDERFRDNPLVTREPYLRFYAGARIDTPEGLPLGTVCVLDTKARPGGITATQKEILVTLAKQVTSLLELRRASDTRELMGRELRHRIKNVFAVVGGLVSASSRAHPEAKDFVQSLQGRLGALAKAQDYVQPAEESHPHTANPQRLHALIETILSPYADRGNRLSISGDDPRAGTAAATSLALIIHEQATNAVKYGSLSNDDGGVEITCWREGDRFLLRWREHGGPPVPGEPARQGFGTRLVARSAAQLDGEVSYSWHPGGLEMVLEVDAGRLAA